MQREENRTAIGPSKSDLTLQRLGSNGEPVRVTGRKEEARWISNEAVLSSLDSDFSLERGYFSSDLHLDTRPSVQSRQRRAVRTVEYQADSVPETQVGLLFTVSSVVPDFRDRRFSINRTSVGSNLVNVDPFTGNVFLTDGQRLDYEDEDMRQITVVLEATKLTDNSGTGKNDIGCISL
ncbi:hypothetical protein BaRGS_00004033 [Batillaria attramentaria]|uniref:Cadherin domain-containing protein n=1 Tax=Batillaria attramentaria TaxID=370345 RepID=A0ABD0LYN3_9CAEN